MGVLRGVFVLKSGLRILIRAPEVPFFGTPKIAKWPILGVQILFLLFSILPSGQDQRVHTMQIKYIDVNMLKIESLTSLLGERQC